MLLRQARPRPAPVEAMVATEWWSADRGRLARFPSYPEVLLGVAIVVWGVVFAVLVYYRHHRFESFDFDLGIYDQAVWLLARGESFDTVRGLPVFGHHLNLGLLLFVPFYWLGAGPDFLNLVMVAALALGAVPVFMAAEHHLRNEWLALALAVAFLLHFTSQWLIQETFHPDVMAVTPLLMAYVYALRRRWGPYALWVAFAVLWKEDVALAATVLGLLLAWRGHRQVGLWTAGVALAYFLLATQVVMPALYPEGPFYEGFFGDLGTSPSEIVETAVTDPSVVGAHLDQAQAPAYVRDLALPYAFVPFLAPGGLLIGLPQALINLLSVQSFTWSTRAHYVALPLVGLTIALVEGVARWPQPGVRRFLVGLVGAFALTTSTVWGISPFSEDFSAGHWPLRSVPRQQVLQGAVDLPPPDAAVSATYLLVPHLTHRRNIYTFPNPWKTGNWGVRDENPRDPRVVDWLVIDRQSLGEHDRLLLAEIMGSGKWRTHHDDDDVLVAQRQ